MTQVRILQVFVGALASMLFACGGSTPSLNKSFNVVFLATSDDGEPVQGAKFSSGTTTIGTTDKTGRIAVALEGVDGQSVPMTVSCPDSYVPPEEQPALRLTEVRKVNQVVPAPISVETICTRKMRDVVLVVRTNNAPSLPVDIGGRSAGQTDADGNALFHLKLDREMRSVSVSLSTAASPSLRPQNPSRVFELDGQDAVLLVDQAFSVDRKSQSRRRVASNAAPNKRIPYRIDSGKVRGF